MCRLVLLLLLSVVALGEALEIELRWTPPAEMRYVERYEVYKRSGLAAPEEFVCLALPPVVTCMDRAPLLGTTLYTVYAFGHNQWSPVSNMVKVVIEHPPGQGVSVTTTTILGKE